MDSLPNVNTVYSPPRQSLMMWVIVWGAVAVSALFHIFATLGASLRVGRLSVVPTYDDVSYLVDGLHRLKAFDVAGFRGLFSSLAIEPAHAPLTTITATIGFALTPGEAVGSYALGGVWVILFLALAAILLKEMPRLTLAGILLAFLAVPALGSLISEFRPDLSWGLLTGFAGMLLLSTNVLNTKSST